MSIRSRMRCAATLLVWLAFLLLTLYVTLCIPLDGSFAAPALLFLAAFLGSMCLGALIGLWPGSWRYRVDVENGGVVGVESWWLTISGCDLRKVGDLNMEVSDHALRAPAALVDERSADRWMVINPGRVHQKHRLMAALYNMGKDAPRVVSPWGDISPPRAGGIYLLNIPGVDAES